MSLEDVFLVPEKERLREWPELEPISDTVTVEGFQLYVVEKWIGAEHPWTIVLQTQSPEDKVQCVQCRLAKKEKDSLLQDLLGPKKDLNYLIRMYTAPEKNGYVPVKTEQGILMVRKRGSIEAGLELVHIPDGDVAVHVTLLKQQILMKRLGLVPPSHHLSIDRLVVKEMETRFRDTYNIGVQVTLMDSLELALRMLKQQLDTLGFKTPKVPMMNPEKFVLAVKSFQEFEGLEPSGYLDKAGVERLLSEEKGPGKRGLSRGIDSAIGTSLASVVPSKRPSGVIEKPLSALKRGSTLGLTGTPDRLQKRGSMTPVAHSASNSPQNDRHRSKFFTPSEGDPSSIAALDVASPKKKNGHHLSILFPPSS